MIQHVTEVSVPAEVDDLRLYDRVDYQDAYAVAETTGHSPEQWLRAFLEDAPTCFRLAWAGLGKALLGAHFGPLTTVPGYVMGWQVRCDRPEVFVVGLDSSRGLSARLAAVTLPGQVVIATQIRLSTGYVRTLWPAIRRGHRYFAPYLLDRAARNSGEVDTAT